MKDEIAKLTNTVYNLLEYFPESDLLKNKAKEKALAIIENLSTKDIDILLGYLKIAQSQGWISEISFLIVNNEYEKIKKEIGAPVIIPEIPQEKNFELSARQEKIISFLQQNQKAQVADLMAVLPNITKRTIRRDLDELLKMGKIAREGEFNQILYKIRLVS